MGFSIGAKKSKPRKAPNNPERFSTMPQAKKRHKSLQKNTKQGKRAKKPSAALRQSTGGLGRISDALK